MESDRTTVSALQQEITQLKHKLRIRSQLVSSLQHKSSTKDGLDVQQLYSQIEDLTLEITDLRRVNTDLASENAILGKAVGKLKEMQGGFSVKELQDALLDANDELDKAKNTIETQQSTIETQQTRISELEKRIQNLEMDSKKTAESAVFREKTDDKSWKTRYLKEVQTIFSMQTAQAALAEENRCHVEFISVLERKVANLEANYRHKFNEAVSTLHETRFRNAYEALERCRSSPLLQEQTAAAVLRTELVCERDVNEELRKEIRRISAEVEELRANLAVARANLIQAAMRGEEQCARVKALEDMRVMDVRSLVRLEG